MRSKAGSYASLVYRTTKIKKKITTGNNDKTPLRLRFNVLSIDYVRVINCFYDYDYDYDYDMKNICTNM